MVIKAVISLSVWVKSVYALEHFCRSCFFLFQMVSYVSVKFCLCFFWRWPICKYACAHMDA